MTRLYVVCEGPTERVFVERSLAPHLASHGVVPVGVVVTTSFDRRRGRTHREGGRWSHWAREIERLRRFQAGDGAWITTMFDLYGLPSDAPGDPAATVEAREQAMAAAIDALDLGDGTTLGAWAAAGGGLRFIPYIQVHEFEALVLAALDDLVQVFDENAWIDLDALGAVIEAAGPEGVNDGFETCPSRRLQFHLRGYDKVLHGEIALMNTTVDALAARCPHFGAWVRQLERLGRS